MYALNVQMCIRDREKGMMGEPVKKLQQALKSAGYYSGTCDG